LKQNPIEEARKMRYLETMTEFEKEVKKIKGRLIFATSLFFILGFLITALI